MPVSAPLAILGELARPILALAKDLEMGWMKVLKRTCCLDCSGLLVDTSSRVGKTGIDRIVLGSNTVFE